MNQLQSVNLSTAHFVRMIIEKLKRVKSDQLPEGYYGLFEQFANGIERLVPDTQPLVKNKNLLHGKSKFIIRKKKYFELIQTDRLRLSRRVKVLYEKLASDNQRKQSIEHQNMDVLLNKGFMADKKISHKRSLSPNVKMDENDEEYFFKKQTKSCKKIKCTSVFDTSKHVEIVEILYVKKIERLEEIKPDYVNQNDKKSNAFNIDVKVKRSEKLLFLKKIIKF